MNHKSMTTRVVLLDSTLSGYFSKKNRFLGDFLTGEEKKERRQKDYPLKFSL